MFRLEFKLYNCTQVVWLPDPYSLTNELLYLRNKGGEVIWISTFVIVDDRPVFPDEINDNDPVDDDGLPF